MEILVWPDMPWEGKPFACLTCGIVVAFDRRDLGGIGRISPRKEHDKWTARKTCPLCGVYRKFVEVEGANDVSDEGEESEDARTASVSARTDSDIPVNDWTYAVLEAS